MVISDGTNLSQQKNRKTQMGKRGRPFNKEFCLLLFGLHAYADLTFEEIGESFGISRQAVHQQWQKGHRFIGGIPQSERTALIECCCKLRKADTPIIIEFDNPRGNGPYDRKWEWDPSRLGRPCRDGKIR